MYIGQKQEGCIFIPRSTNVFKVLLNNKFKTFVVSPNGGAILSGEGKFTVESDSVYTETIENHQNEMIIGTNNKIEYKLMDNK